MSDFISISLDSDVKYKRIGGPTFGKCEIVKVGTLILTAPDSYQATSSTAPVRGRP
jgi:hypothetical protein